MDFDELKKMMVKSHTSTTRQWVEVYPDGTINQAEEADNNTTHWISYPEKAVANIYTISNANCGCNCDICIMYKHFEGLCKEEFIEAYGEDDWEYCNDNSLEQAIYDYSTDNGVFPSDIRDAMLEAIDDIEFGYFDDENA